MLICIQTFEYNLQYDRWENALKLLKDLLRDCLRDKNYFPISTCCNVYTYHGFDLTYVDFYNVLDDDDILNTMKKRSIVYSEYVIKDVSNDDIGDLVLVDDEEEEMEVESPKTEYCGVGICEINKTAVNSFVQEYSDNNVSDYLISTMESNIVYYEPEQIMYCYEKDRGWVKYDREKLHTLVSSNFQVLFAGRDEVIRALGSFIVRSRIVTDMIMKIKSRHGTSCINLWNAIGFKNGIYQNDVGIFSPFCPSLYVTLSTHVPYIPNEDKQDTILSYILSMIFPNPIVRKAVTMWFGYLLVSGNPEKILTVWHGATGNNGKSWVQRLIREAMGDYYATLPISLLTSKRPGSSNPTPELACLENSLVVMLQEPDTTERMNGGRVKELTGNDSIFIRELYKSPRSINIRAKIVVVANNRIETVGLDSALRRRFFVIPFESTFVTPRELEMRKSRNTDTKNYYIRQNIDGLCRELAPAFLRLAIREHRNYVEKGLEVSEDFYRYTIEFVMSNNKILRFIHRYLVPEPGERYLISALYESFKVWYRDLYPSMRQPDSDAFVDELNKESIKIIDDKYLDGYVCVYSPIS